MPLQFRCEQRSSCEDDDGESSSGASAQSLKCASSFKVASGDKKPPAGLIKSVESFLLLLESTREQHLVQIASTRAKSKQQSLQSLLKTFFFDSDTTPKETPILKAAAFKAIVTQCGVLGGEEFLWDVRKNWIPNAPTLHISDGRQDVVCADPCFLPDSTIHTLEQFESALVQSVVGMFSQKSGKLSRKKSSAASVARSTCDTAPSALSVTLYPACLTIRCLGLVKYFEAIPTVITEHGHVYRLRSAHFTGPGEHDSAVYFHDPTSASFNVRQSRNSVRADQVSHLIYILETEPEEAGEESIASDDEDHVHSLEDTASSSQLESAAASMSLAPSQSEIEDEVPPTPDHEDNQNMEDAPEAAETISASLSESSQPPLSELPSQQHSQEPSQDEVPDPVPQSNLPLESQLSLPELPSQQSQENSLPEQSQGELSLRLEFDSELDPEPRSGQLLEGATSDSAHETSEPTSESKPPTSATKHKRNLSDSSASQISDIEHTKKQSRSVSSGEIGESEKAQPQSGELALPSLSMDLSQDPEPEEEFKDADEHHGSESVSTPSVLPAHLVGALSMPDQLVPSDLPTDTQADTQAAAPASTINDSSSPMDLGLEMAEDAPSAGSELQYSPSDPLTSFDIILKFHASGQQGGVVVSGILEDGDKFGPIVFLIPGGPHSTSLQAQFDSFINYHLKGRSASGSLRVELLQRSGEHFLSGVSASGMLACNSKHNILRSVVAFECVLADQADASLSESWSAKVYVQDHDQLALVKNSQQVEPVRIHSWAPVKNATPFADSQIYTVGTDFAVPESVIQQVRVQTGPTDPVSCILLFTTSQNVLVAFNVRLQCLSIPIREMLGCATLHDAKLTACVIHANHDLVQKAQQDQKVKFGQGEKRARSVLRDLVSNISDLLYMSRIISSAVAPLPLVVFHNEQAPSTWSLQTDKFQPVDFAHAVQAKLLKESLQALLQHGHVESDQARAICSQHLCIVTDQLVEFVNTPWSAVIPSFDTLISDWKLFCQEFAEQIGRDKKAALEAVQKAAAADKAAAEAAAEKQAQELRDTRLKALVESNNINAASESHKQNFDSVLSDMCVPAQGVEVPGTHPVQLSDLFQQRIASIASLFGDEQEIEAKRLMLVGIGSLGLGGTNSPSVVQTVHVVQCSATVTGPITEFFQYLSDLCRRHPASAEARTSGLGICFIQPLHSDEAAVTRFMEVLRNKSFVHMPWSTLVRVTKQANERFGALVAPGASGPFQALARNIIQLRVHGACVLTTYGSQSSPLPPLVSASSTVISDSIYINYDAVCRAISSHAQLIQDEHFLVFIMLFRADRVVSSASEYLPYRFESREEKREEDEADKTISTDEMEHLHQLGKRGWIVGGLCVVGGAAELAWRLIDSDGFQNVALPLIQTPQITVCSFAHTSSGSTDFNPWSVSSWSLPKEQLTRPSSHSQLNPAAGALSSFEVLGESSPEVTAARTAIIDLQISEVAENNPDESEMMDIDQTGDEESDTDDEGEPEPVKVPTGGKAPRRYATGIKTPRKTFVAESSESPSGSEAAVWAAAAAANAAATVVDPTTFAAAATTTSPSRTQYASPASAAAVGKSSKASSSHEPVHNASVKSFTFDKDMTIAQVIRNLRHIGAHKFASVCGPNLRYASDFLGKNQKVSEWTRTAFKASSGGDYGMGVLMMRVPKSAVSMDGTIDFAKSVRVKADDPEPNPAILSDMLMTTYLHEHGTRKLFDDPEFDPFDKAKKTFNPIKDFYHSKGQKKVSEANTEQHRALYGPLGGGIPEDWGREEYSPFSVDPPAALVAVFGPDGLQWYPTADNQHFVRTPQLNIFGAAEARLLQCTQQISGNVWRLPAKANHGYRPHTVADRFLEHVFADGLVDYVGEEGKSETPEHRLHKQRRHALHGKEITSRICDSYAHYHNEVLNPMFSGLSYTVESKGNRTKPEVITTNSSPIEFTNASDWDVLMAPKKNLSELEPIVIRGCGSDEYFVSQRYPPNYYSDFHSNHLFEKNLKRVESSEDEDEEEDEEYEDEE